MVERKTVTNVPPLPLVDGCLFIDNSFLELLQTCPRSLLFNRLVRRVASAEKPSLSFGSAGHLVWEHRYRHCKNQTPTEEDENNQADILQKFFNENPPPEDDFRNLNWAEECLVKQYNKHYQVEPFNVLEDEKGQPMVEMSFALPLFEYKSEFFGFPVPIIYTGRIDLPVLWDGKLIIIDHKTTSLLGDTFWYDHKVSPQQIGYCWAFQELTKRSVSGFCINAVRVRPMPANPKGGVAAWWDESLQRYKEYIQPWQLVEWKTNTIALIEEFFWHYQRGLFPAKKKWCCGKYGRCPYYDVCDLPPEDRGVMLSSTLFQENNWSPLKQPTAPMQ